jgi:hypothetical protein
VVHQFLSMLTAPAAVSGKVFFLADYEPTDVRVWAQAIAAATSARSVREAPLWVMRTLAWGGDVLRFGGMRNPPLTSERLRNLLTASVVDVSAIATITGPLPYRLVDGVDETVAWMRQRGLL